MAEQIGEVTILHGSAAAEGPDGIRELTLGSPIFNDDVIVTEGKSALEIQFSDGALLSQGANSKVHLDDYVFDPDIDAGEITMNLIEGTFRSVTGQIVDINPEGFKIDTPNTTIGIRGTTTGHTIGADGEETHVVLDFVDKPVIFTSRADGTTQIITRDGYKITASPTGISSIERATPAELSQFEQLSTGSMQQSAPDQNGNEPGDGDNADGGNADGEAADGAEQTAEEAAQAAEDAAEVAAQAAAEAAAAQAAAEAAAQAAAQAAAEAADAAAQAAAQAAAEAAAQAAEVAAQAAAEAAAAADTAAQAAADAAALAASGEGVGSGGVFGGAGVGGGGGSLFGNGGDAGDGDGFGDGDDFGGSDGSSGGDDPLFGGDDPGDVNPLFGQDDDDPVEGGVYSIETALDLSTETDPMTVNLVGGSPPYYEVTGDPATRVNISEDIRDVFGSSTQPNDITGDEHSNLLVGGSDADTLSGGDGNDILMGLGGADDLDGGNDFDYANYFLSPAGISVNMGTGAVSDGFGATDTLTDIEGIIGSEHNDDISDNSTALVSHFMGMGGNDMFSIYESAVDTIEGGAGNDQISLYKTPLSGTVIDGGDGYDILGNAGSGDLDFRPVTVMGIEEVHVHGGNTLIFNDNQIASDWKIDDTNASEDETVEIHMTTSGTLDVSDFTFGSNWLGNDKVSLVGSAGNDTIRGSSGKDSIDGGTGNDLIKGNAGDDVLKGGAGTDVLYYQHLSTSNGDTAITVDLDTSTVSNDGQGGSDSIANFEALEATNYDDTITTSSSFASFISANDGADSITYMGQADTIHGDSGNDTFFVGVTIAAGTDFDGCTGTDRIETTNVAVDIDFRLLATADNIEEVKIAEGSYVWFKSGVVSGESWELQGSGSASVEIFKASLENGGDSIDLSDFSFHATEWHTAEDRVEIIGGTGDDAIIGSTWDDSITGGTGSDTFHYTSSTQLGDTITDYTNGDDSFRFDFTSLGVSLDAGEFARVTSSYIGDEGAISGEGFIYEVISGTEGVLWYDLDGSTTGNESVVASITQTGTGITGEVGIDDISLV